MATTPAAEKNLYDFYGISHTTRHTMLPKHGIRVRITETGAGAPVVIVPGNTGDGFPFIPLLPHLPGRRIITINRPGGGLSEGMDHTTVDFHDFAVETLTTVFDALELDHAPIIAHSIGGHWSQWFAITRPERVTALALLGVPGNVLTTRPTLLLRLTTIPALGEVIGRLTVPKEPGTALNGLKITGHAAESIARQAALSDSYYRFANLPHYLTSTLSLMTAVNRLSGSKPRYWPLSHGRSRTWVSWSRCRSGHDRAPGVSDREPWFERLALPRCMVARRRRSRSAVSVRLIQPVAVLLAG